MFAEELGASARLGHGQATRRFCKHAEECQQTRMVVMQASGASHYDKSCWRRGRSNKQYDSARVGTHLDEGLLLKDKPMFARSLYMARHRAFSVEIGKSRCVYSCGR